jgi:anti-sigma regulatory factor (Ser/Thr protein kinase)
MTLWLGHRVELEFPMQPQLFFLARMLAGAVAVRAEFEEQQVHDLRLAVDELLLNLVRGRVPQKTIHVDYEWSDHSIEVVATLYEGWTAVRHQLGKSLEDDSLSEELSESILGAVVDQHGAPTKDQVPIAWLRLSKR